MLRGSRRLPFAAAAIAAARQREERRRLRRARKLLKTFARTLPLSEASGCRARSSQERGFVGIVF